MIKSPIKSIRDKCLDCSSGSTKTIKYCTVYTCPLWKYRFGMRPETAKNNYGKKYLKPELMPEADIPIDDLS